MIKLFGGCFCGIGDKGEIGFDFKFNIIELVVCIFFDLVDFLYCFIVGGCFNFVWFDFVCVIVEIDVDNVCFLVCEF